MALSSEEISKCHRSLARIAKESGLDWVVSQVESQIALGRIRTGKIRAKEVPLRNAGEELIHLGAKGRPTKFTLSEEFTPEEKLIILIEALEHAVSGVWRTAMAVCRFMSDNVSEIREVKFMPDGISREPFGLLESELHIREKGVRDFERLVAELKEAI